MPHQYLSAMDAAITHAIMAPKATRMGLSPLFHFAFFKNGNAASLLTRVSMFLFRSQSVNSHRKIRFWLSTFVSSTN